MNSEPVFRQLFDTVEEESEWGEEFADLTLDENYNESLYKISNLDAFWNTCSSVQGMAMLAMPMAALFGGYWFVIATIAIAWVSNYTSKILVRCLYEELPGNGRVRVRDTYADIGDACWPIHGRHLVVVTKFLELIFVATVNPVVCGEALYFAFPGLSISKRIWILIFGLAMAPNVFVKSIKLLSSISMLTIILSYINFAIIVGYSFAKVRTWNVHDLLVFDAEKFPLAVGVISASYSSQIYLAVVEGNMRKPEDFNKVIDYGYIAMTVVKLGVGVLGYLTFSRDTNEVVTNNLPGGLRTGANVLILILSFLGYSLPMFAVFDMVENSASWYMDARFLDAKYKRPNRVCSFLMRLGLTGITILMGVLVPHFTLMVAFIGNFTGTCIIFVFPCLFYMKLTFAKIQWYEVFLNVFIIVFGVALMVVGLLFTGRDLVQTYTTQGVDY